MLFNSIKFIFFFLPVVLFVAWRLRGQALLRWITLSSFVFYAFAGHAWFLIPMLVTTILDFWVAQRIPAAGTRARKGYLWLSLCGNLGLLFYFKYSTLLLRSGVAVADWLGLPTQGWASAFDVILPAGISFYTFQTLSYIIDVYRGEAKPETNFWKFAGFVSFFPHLVAGPLTRHNQLLPSLEAIAQNRISPCLREGLFLFSAGLIKKTLLADRIAVHIDPMINDMGSLGFSGAWLALLGYALQIYFDFSGYCDMAIGLGRLFAVELPQNFNSPYQALSPSDFWKRWHMTLSAWLRDYLYITMGGSRCSERRRRFNLMATMVLGGLWHGAHWTFAAWGCYHGLLLVAFHAFEAPWASAPVVARRGVTFVAVCLGWVFFRADNFPAASAWFSRLFGLHGFGALPHAHRALPALIALGLLVVFGSANASSYKHWKTLGAPAQVALGLATVAAVLSTNFASKFLYFQF